MNRTNNIFELLTVDPVLHDRQAGQEPERPCNELMLLDDLDQLEEKNLRLKGIPLKIEVNWYRSKFLVIF